MPEAPTTVDVSAALAGWREFAAEGKKRMAQEDELKDICDRLYSWNPLANMRQPVPVRFYGPGPDGRLHARDQPVGTLHFARWRHELAGVEDPDGHQYHHEENAVIINGLRVRPTYTTKRSQPAKEVNYFRWQKVPADWMRNVKTFPGPSATPRVHDEYLLNDGDFNEQVRTKSTVLVSLDNRKDEDPKDIYPLGYKLLKKWSEVHGGSCWQDGDCLGADPHNSHALKRHIGWFPERLRMVKAGLGADPQDAIWNQVFHGNLDVEANKKFSPPKETWSKDPHKVTTLTGSESNRTNLNILSFTALKASLQPPEPETLDVRKAWVDSQATMRPGWHNFTNTTTNALTTNWLSGPFPAEMEAIASIGLRNKLEARKTMDELEIKAMTESKGPIIAEKRDDHGTTSEPGASDIDENDTSLEKEAPIRDDVDEAHEAIKAAVEELYRNPEPGQEGKTPIVIYSAVRSKLLGKPVTQVLGYKS
ncbi:hypothetical protein SAMD00023353_4000810 [Rosellinia necatrix]|uniref:Uncharacterized protein n=1 Tax=Rosellinia necatrix TaxID=77044 RepID=A0A1W2TM88_ROSNE|nr:hypothetical protein SAMD00023353_4000810 [Rosellinia necatrix]